jgi:uncharacterized protein (UPF0332 family)
MNFKQEELIDELIAQIQERYPEVELIRVTESPENSSSLWIEVTAPEDEDREIDLIEFSGDLVTDVLMDYGYHMLVMPTRYMPEAVRTDKKEIIWSSAMVNAFFRKAEKNLAAAEICFENNLYDAAANRAYYAVFQAAVAALAHYGIQKKRLDHEWAQAQFNGKLVKRRKVFPGKLKSYLPDMQALRDLADYKTDSVSKKDASRQNEKAREMLRFIGKEIQNDEF